MSRQATTIEETLTAETIRGAVDRYFPRIAFQTSFEEGDVELLEGVLHANPDVKILWKDTGDPAARARAEYVKAKYYVTPLRSGTLDWNLEAVITSRGVRVFGKVAR